jgi:hypothetical protein
VTLASERSLERPYAVAHERSVRRQMRQPRSLHEYLRWFIDAWNAETPEAMHASGVWRARPARVDENGEPVEDIPAEEIGGSILGSPRDAEPFRQLIENSPRQTAYYKPADYDGAELPHYVRPMRAALDRMAGRGSDQRPGALMARNLRRLAISGGDWRGTAFDGNCYDEHFAAIYWEAALTRLWHAFERE